MRILYDHQAFAMQKYGGISRCFVELYKNLPPDVEASISLCKSDNAYVKEIMDVQPKDTRLDLFLNNHQFKGKWYVQMMLNRFREHHADKNVKHSIEMLKKGAYDVFHPTFYDDYFLPYLNGKPFVLTIHDMTPELYPQYFGRKDPQIVLKQKLASLATTIIAVSENTKKDIIRILGVPEEKVQVVYHGCCFPTPDEQASPYDFPYILFVGGRGWFKNFLPFVKSVASVLKNHYDIKVVCIGKPFTNEESTVFKELGLSGRFVRKYAETDKELSTLYNHALCFVYPSEYEGFGMPILEAYKADCPVLLNNSSCFPEIADDAAIYFRMNTTCNNLAEQVEEVICMSTRERNNLLIKQRKRFSKFSWEQSTKKLSQIYNSLV